MPCRIVRLAGEKIRFDRGSDGFAYQPKSMRPAIAAGSATDIRFTFDDNEVGVQPIVVMGPNKADILDYMRLQTTAQFILGRILSSSMLTIHFDWQVFHPSRPSVEIYSGSGAAARYIRKRFTATMVSAAGAAATGAATVKLVEKIIVGAPTKITQGKDGLQKAPAAINRLLIRHGLKSDPTAESGLFVHYLPTEQSVDTGLNSISFPALVEMIENKPRPLPPASAGLSAAAGPASAALVATGPRIIE